MKKNKDTPLEEAFLDAQQEVTTLEEPLQPPAAVFVMTTEVAQQWLKVAGLRKVAVFDSIRFDVDTEDQELGRIAAFLSDKALKKGGSIYVAPKDRALGVFNAIPREKELLQGYVVLKHPRK